MTYTNNNGGPAFPCQEEASTSFSGCPVTIQHSGMSLRDYFAAVALQGLVVSTNYDTTALCAEDAYRLADAMLAERIKKRRGKVGG